MELGCEREERSRGKGSQLRSEQRVEKEGFIYISFIVMRLNLFYKWKEGDNEVQFLRN